MCGIVGVVAATPVNQVLYDALLLLQHRGQDAAGIATVHGNRFCGGRSALHCLLHNIDGDLLQIVARHLCCNRTFLR